MRAAALTELGPSDTEGGAITGKTSETFRYYAKQPRVLMVAKGAADRVIAGQIKRLMGTRSASMGNGKAVKSPK
ncbi:hypothetical protein [Sphingomonas sp.]|uniref:hypothetical protein n=1 Tax=Sphingomonas sp. TaxID=28214 RepID=UPI000DB1CF64|nr:hypothetical protein [Sphingomonas sp.]PZU08249.1 MAG: hypothetical protein DI605_13515 [Sphingomonas sp.]